MSTATNNLTGCYCGPSIFTTEVNKMNTFENFKLKLAYRFGGAFEGDLKYIKQQFNRGKSVEEIKLTRANSKDLTYVYFVIRRDPESAYEAWKSKVNEAMSDFDGSSIESNMAYGDFPYYDWFDLSYEPEWVAKQVCETVMDLDGRWCKKHDNPGHACNCYIGVAS
jgi:hypothetical protein